MSKVKKIEILKLLIIIIKLRNVKRKGLDKVGPVGHILPDMHFDVTREHFLQSLNITLGRKKTLLISLKLPGFYLRKKYC